MRALLQRVAQARVMIDQNQIAEIGSGLLLLLGVGPDDGEEQARYLARKIARLRIFEDKDGKTNLSILDVRGEALVVSQFTLYADTRKGLRPSFTNAAPPDVAEPLVKLFSELLRDEGVPTQMGEFGAHMNVELINDGPMTIFLERD